MKQLNYFMLPGIPQRPKFTPIEKLQKHTAEFFNISLAELTGKNRKRLFVEARFFFFHYGNKRQYHTLSALARSCGGRDHTTVIHGVNTISNLAEVDKHYQGLMERFIVYMDSQKN